MQATLLGVGIAIILALVAALVGPLFIDWSQYRAVFESEATRMVGLPVHVTGAIDARILPTPSLALRGVQVGSGEQRVEARELDIEFALGSLMRGTFRAADVRLVGPELRVGLNADGRVGWPAGQGGIDPEQLSIDRLVIEDGRAMLTDARSGTSLGLDKFSFTGEMRSLVGPVKGEGGFSANGESYGYRLTAGRASEDGSVKVRVTLDPPSHGLTFDADGAVRFDATAGFEGTLTVARPAGIAADKGRGVAVAPWRATGRVKATATSALFEQVEFQYGPEERAIKLGGIADIRFGKNPRLNGVLSAREIDLDRALDLPETVRRQPITALRAMLDSVGGTIRLPVPAQLGIGVDSATLAGGAVQAVRGDFKSDGSGLDIESLEFRAPGATQVRLSGRLEASGQDASFAGPVAVETSDPQALAAWLEGRPAVRGQAGSLRASGQVSLGPERVALDRLKGEIDRKPFEGRVLHVRASGNVAPRLEAEFKAADLDIDRILAVGRTVLGTTTPDLPAETMLSLEIGHASVADVAFKDIAAKLRFDKAGLNVERLAVGDLGGATISLSGRIETALASPRGALTLDLDARNLDGALGLVARVAPDSAQTMRALAPRVVPLKTHATVSFGERGADIGKLAVEGTAGALRLRFTAEAKGDLSNPPALDVRLDGNVAADNGVALMQLLGLDSAVAISPGPSRLNVTAQGPLGREIRVDAGLAAAGLTVAANGTARVIGDQTPVGTLQITASADDVRGLRAANAAGPKLPATLKARVTAKPDTLAFDDVTATMAGVPMRGRIETALATPLRIDGQLDVESLNAASLIGAVIGAPASASDAATMSAEPFASGLLGKANGRLQLGVARAVLTPSLALRQARASVRLGERELALEDIDGELAGGRLAGEASFRRTDDGVASHLRFALGDADISALLSSTNRPTLTGRVTLQVEADGTGLSPATLIGSLTGGGSVTFSGGEIAGLDPKTFDAAMRAADQGGAIDAPKLKQLTETALDRGSFKFARGDGALTIANGQTRLGTTIVRGEGADLSVVGSLDLADRNLDVRLTLSGAPVEGTSGRPELQATVKGPIGGARRAVDVTALSAWLTLRLVERETRRIDAIEAERRDAIGAIEPTQPTAPPASVRPPATAPRALPAEPARPRPAQPNVRPDSSAVPALPPPVDIRPAPSAGAAPPRPPPPAATNGAAQKHEKEAGPAETTPPPSRSILDRLFGPQR